MVIPPAALIEKEEEEKNLAEKLHANVQVERAELNGRVGGEGEEEEEEGKNPPLRPLRYVSLCDVYSATSPCVSSASGGSKKVKLPHHHHHRKSLGHFSGHDHHPSKPFQLSSLSEVMSSNINADSNSGRMKPPITHFYSRRYKDKRKREEDEEGEKEPSNADMCPEVKKESFDGANGELIPDRRKKRKSDGHEGVNFGVGNSTLVDRDMVGLKEAQNTIGVGNDVRNKASIAEIDSCNNNNRETRRQKNKVDTENEVKQSGSLRKKKWVWLSFSGVDPMKFVKLQCKVFWPLDADWYEGRIIGYDFETGRHNVEYVDGDKEKLVLSNERIKFYLSSEEMQRLKLKSSDKSSEADGIDVDEMVVLAASLDDCQELEPGDIIWAKLTGHAMWPAVVLDESLAGGRMALKKHAGEKSVLVQFFGTHDFARVRLKQVISFLKGLLSSFHLKCKKPNFVCSLEEAKMYLSELKLPRRMLRLRDGIQADGDYGSHAGDNEDDVGIGEPYNGTIRTFPFDVGDLKILSLGKIVKDSDNFHDEKFIWPEGYTALRKFSSISDSSVHTTYKMEVLRDDDMRCRPIFKVTSESGEQYIGSTPSACWSKIYKKMRKIQSDGLKAEARSERVFESGVDMFGFSYPEISKLIEELSNSRSHSKASKMATAKHQDLPPGYRPVDVTWKDLDKCNVCHMDEEYENNLFLQCEKCRMMVHARCYGELEPQDGVLWLCNLCRPGAPQLPPACCLCPVTGGAMKPTTDGRWAHLACAIWIPETCLSDIKKMEPIDGLSRINKDRWKLLCSICGVSYGACIQCSNNSCRVAYHPLCARAAGFCVELEDEDRLHLIPLDEDEDDQCIRLLSFCKRHRPQSNRHRAEERIGKAFDFSDYMPSRNPSGCARTEPYNYFGRRGRKEPEALAAASLKRLYVENRPHLVGGFSHHDPSGSNASSIRLAGSEYSVDLQNMKISKHSVSGTILSMAEKYRYMRETFRKRLAFGKSGIHGFGIFAKHPHKAGDMVIEYTGELVRPSIADRREHLIYNSLVGAGTYMFRIDDERVIDATRAGSIAHLINHSCEPNCYSRVITVSGDEHIIIFAKRDIKQWEELTYDYRFVATDEQLACYCGFPRCRGVVNDTEAEERATKLYVSRCELIECSRT